MKELSLKEKRFIENYTNILNKETYSNALQSYKQAGYKASNVNVAGVCGHKLLMKGKIMAKINEIEAQREFDLQSAVDEHINTISTILDGIKAKGKYSREDLAAARFLAECAGKIGTNKIAVNNVVCLGQDRLQAMIAETRAKIDQGDQANRDLELSNRGDK